MNTKNTIKIIFPLVDGCTIRPSKKIEVSLDCPICKRVDRTVVIKKDKEISVCMPTGHQFNASITGIEVDNVIIRKFLFKKIKLTRIVYNIEYDYNEFFDEKDKLNSNPHPGWSRINFDITCPKCHHASKKSTQNNLARPLDVSCDNCSTFLYRETTELPIVEQSII